MSRRNFFQDLEQDVFLGMDSTSPVSAVKPGYVVSAKNCYPGLSGGWIKRDGYATQLSSVWTGLSVTAGIEYLPSASTRRTILFGTDTLATGGKLGTVSAGAVSNLVTGLSGTARPSLFQFNSLLFFFNGSDSPLVYDGSATRQVGITAPAAAPTAVLAGGGSLTANASYIWAYTYYNSVTGAESSPSALSATTAMGANTQSTLTLLAGSATTADTIRIYRTPANGLQLFLDGTAAIGATSYVSTVADSALTTALELDNSLISDWSATAKYPAVVRRRVFLKTGTNEIRHSKIGQSGPMPESFEAKALVDTNGTFGANDDIVGISAAGDVPIVLKERSVGALQEQGIPALQATDPVYYNYYEISTDAGAISHWAAVQVYGECLFLGKDNIYGTRGQPGDLRPVANSIRTTIKALGFSSSQVSKVSAVNDTKLKLVLFQVFTSSSATVPSYTLVGNYELYPNIRWSLYTPGTNTTTHPGIKAGCLFSVTNSTDGTLDVMFGNAELNGQYYKLSSGTTDNTKGIYFEVVSRPYDGKSVFSQKLFKDGVVFASGDGTAYNLTVSAIYDLSGEEENSQTLSLTSGGSVWDTGVWDTATYGSLASPPREYATHRKARYQQLVFRQTDASAPLTLFAWGTSGSIFRPF